MMMMMMVLMRQALEGRRSILYNILFCFIDTLPEEGNAITACCRCLLGGRLMTLAFDPVARSEG